MSSDLSLHQVQEPVAPTPLRPQTRVRISWGSIAQSLATPSWVPEWDALPIWATDPAVVAEAVTEHAGSDVLSAAQTADLVARIARRNTVAAHQLVERMAAGGLDQLTDAWTSVLEAWASAAEVDAVDLTAGPVAVTIARYLTVAARLELTPAQAARFAATTDSQLFEAVARPTPVTRVQVALAAHPHDTYAQIARIAGVSDSYCRMIVVRYGDPRRDERSADNRPDLIRGLAKQGVSYRRIAADVGCSVGYVAKVLK